MHNYPVSFTNYAQQLSFYNPAATSLNTEWEASISNRRNTGFWRNNQTSLGYGSIRVQAKKSINYHGIGMSLYYDKEGNYLKRYRGYLQYAYHASINEKWQASAGFSLGIMTYQVGNDDYASGGSASNLDGSFGLLLTSKLTTIGFTVAQLTERKVQPIVETTLLARYYQLFLGRDVEMNKDWIWRNNFNLRVYSISDQGLNLQTGILWNNSVGLYGLYQWKRQASVLFSLEKIEWESIRFKLFASYDMALNGDQRYQAFEFTLQCMKPAKPSSKDLQRKVLRED